MKASEIKIGKRVFHAIFGWCKIQTPANTKGECLVDLEADEIEYYVMGKGYVKYKREMDGRLNRNILLTHIDELFISEKEVTSIMRLKKTALNPKLTFWI
jgi:hypothetical protein